MCLIGVLVSLAGCAGKIHYPNYYVLNIPTPAPEANVPTPVLGSAAVREFSAPRFLKAGTIVYRQTPEQLGFYEYGRWAVDPRGSVTDAFVRALQARGTFKSVHAFDGRTPSEYLVTGSLDHLEEVDQGRDVFVTVGLSAQLLDLKTGEVIWRDVYSESSRLDQHALPGLVAGMSQAAEQAVAHLASSMQDHVTQTAATSGSTNAGQQ
jgi:ABC-type uncharacterized transport system auxiliary subunit